MIPSLARQVSAEIVADWLSDERKIAPAFQSVAAMCCVHRSLLKKSSIQMVLNYLDGRPEQPVHCNAEELKNALGKCLEKGYGNSNQSSCIITKADIRECCQTLFDELSWRKKYFILALHEIAESVDSGMIILILAEICRASGLCLAGKRFGFNALIEVVKHRLQPDETSGSIEQFLERFITDYILKAFRSAFMEPTWAYHLSESKTSCLGEVAEQHAANLYSTLVVGCVGIPVPIGHLDDEYCYGGACLFRQCKSESYHNWLNAMKKPENFGKNFASVEEFKNIKAFNSNERTITQDFLFAQGTPLCRANRALSEAPEYENDRNTLLGYLEFFMYFFTKEYFVPKVMNAFSQYIPKSFQDSFEKYKAEKPEIEEDDFRFWFWNVMDGSLHQDRAIEFLSFLKIIV